MFSFSDPVLIALVVAIAGSSAPLGALALSRINGKQLAAAALAAQKVRHTEREEDYARADELAARVKSEADRLNANQAAQSSRLLESQGQIVEATTSVKKEVKAVKEQTEVIHGLVNASYTAALEAQRVALVGQLESKRDVLEMRLVAPTEPEDDRTPEEKKTIREEGERAIAGIEKQIEVLENNIRNRLEQQHLAEQQVAQAKDGTSSAASP